MLATRELGRRDSSRNGTDLASQPTACPFCFGSGQCHRCGGYGFIRGRRAKPRPWRECEGTGKCALCRGAGWKDRRKPDNGEEGGNRTWGGSEGVRNWRRPIYGEM